MYREIKKKYKNAVQHYLFVSQHLAAFENQAGAQPTHRISNHISSFSQEFHNSLNKGKNKQLLLILIYFTSEV